MIVGMGGGNREIKGGVVSVGGINYKVIKIIAGVSSGNHLVWQSGVPDVPADKIIYSGTIYSGQDYAF